MDITISSIEEEQRRAAIAEGLTQVRLEGMEPHPIFFALSERYIRGEMTLDEAISLLVQKFSTES